MQEGMRMIELAAALDDERARQIEQYRLAASASDRAGPFASVRQRAGRRLISLGERLAYGRRLVVTR